MNVLKLLPFFYKNVIQKNASVKICVAFVTALSILVGRLFRSAADNQSQIISAVLRTVRNTANSQLWFSAVTPSPLINKVKRGFFFHPHQIHNRQSGFTMLELMVVVAILAVIAGSAVMAFRGIDSDASIQTAKVEMRQLGEAIDAYLADLNDIPEPDTLPVTLGSWQQEIEIGAYRHPADISFLLSNPEPLPDPSDPDAKRDNIWSSDYRKGWRGPYIKGIKLFYVDIGDGIKSDATDGSGSEGAPQNIDSAIIKNILALPDKFDNFSVTPGVERSTQACNAADCIYEWQSQIDRFNPNDHLGNRITKFGRPYLLLDLDLFNNDTLPRPGIPRIVSLGPNGVYEPVNCDYTETDSGDVNYCSRDKLCDTSGDDLVLCLR